MLVAAPTLHPLALGVGSSTELHVHVAKTGARSTIILRVQT